jgi:hypothetical protein
VHQQDALRVAVDVFNRADRQPVTMSMVQLRLGELQAHRPSCPKPGLHYAVPRRERRTSYAWPNAANR